MKSRAKLFLLLASVMLLPLSHLDIERSDDSWLLRVDGRPVDLAGELAEWSTRLTRDCRDVQELPSQDPLHALAGRTIQDYSPPSSQSARIVHLSRQGDWLLAQVQFEELQDAVVLLSHSEQELKIAEGAIWSGSTFPHKAEPVIRRYLKSKAPQAPDGLIACFELSRTSTRSSSPALQHPPTRPDPDSGAIRK